MPHVGPWVFVDGRSDRTQGMHHHCLHGAPSTSRGRQWTEPRSDPFIRTILTHDGSAGTSGIRMVEDRQPLQVPPRVVPDRRPTWCQRVGNATSHRGHGICLVGITEHPMVRAIIYIYKDTRCFDLGQVSCPQVHRFPHSLSRCFERLFGSGGMTVLRTCIPPRSYPYSRISPARKWASRCAALWTTLRAHANFRSSNCSWGSCHGTVLLRSRSITV